MKLKQQIEPIGSQSTMAKQAAPKPTEATKGPSPKEIAAEKAKAEQQARQVIVEAAAKEIAEPLQGVKEAEEQQNSRLWDAVDAATHVASTNKFDKKELRSAVVLALSDAYDEKVEAIARGTYLYTMASKLTTIATASQAKETAKMVKKARDKGEGFNAVYALLSKPQTKKDKDGDGDGDGDSEGKGKADKSKFADEQAVKEAFRAVIKKASASGFDYDTIGEVFTTAIADEQAMTDDEEESDEENEE